MSHSPTFTVLASCVLTSAWCIWFLIGIIGHVLPAIGIQNLKLSDGHQAFPAYDLVGEAITAVIAIIAVALIAIQGIALVFRSQFAAITVGITMFLLGTPIVFQLFPIGKIDPAHDLIWDTCFPIALHGSFLLGGVSMLLWARRLTKFPDHQKKIAT